MYGKEFLFAKHSLEKITLGEQGGHWIIKLIVTLARKHYIKRVLTIRHSKCAAAIRGQKLELV